ncbi:MAG: hypothetical protein GXY48_00925 [Methanomicrobiales archaeon]|nr:hypothetical protein [Methanomicrobiales archaeon]
MSFGTGHKQKKSLSWIVVIILVTLTLPMITSADTGGDNIIFNGPFFENYGQGFINWSGDGVLPSGTLLLKGEITAIPDIAEPGEEIEFILDLRVSAMTMTGKDGATLKTTRDRTWTLDTSKLIGENIDFLVIPDSELLGIGVGSRVPDLIVRDTKRIKKVTIPDSTQPGVYAIRAFVNESTLRTRTMNLTITDKTEETAVNNTSVSEIEIPTETPTPEETLKPDSSDEIEDNSDPRFAGMSEKIVNERNLHVTSIYPYSGGAGNTIGIKIYGDHFAAPVYVTLVKDNQGIEAYNYCFVENQKYGVVMVDIPSDTEQGMWDLVITTRDGKATVPFEVTSKLIDPEIISIEAPILTPDAGKDITITGKQLMAPCDILLSGKDLKWFSFSPKPVLMHNTLKIRVKIDAPLSDEISSGNLDLIVWNGDGATTTYENAVSFAIEH